jgi:hypothetical protein
MGIAQAAEVWHYELGKTGLSFIQKRFGQLLRMDDSSFWHGMRRQAFATLISLERVRSFAAVNCKKRDRRGWAVLESVKTGTLFD